MSLNTLVAVSRSAKVKSKETWGEVPLRRNTNEVRKDVCLDWGLLVMTNIANAKLPGYTEGAEIMRPKIENGQIDSMSGIIYSQIKGLRSNRALRMTVMIPRDGKAKPAIIYFPGGDSLPRTMKNLPKCGQL